VIPDCSAIPPALCTVTDAVTSAMPGSALAWITVDPIATPVTGTLTLIAPAANVTLAGTVAAAVLVELRLMIKPVDGAGPERFNVRFCVVGPTMVRLPGENPMVAATCTVCEEVVYPDAEAVMLADPTFTPTT
jgi:hypothetical protein